MSVTAKDLTVKQSIARSGFAVKADSVGLRPVIWFAGLGALCWLLETYVIGSWITGPDFTPAPKGADPIASTTLFWIRFYETGSALVGVAMALWAWRTSRKQGTLSLEAIMVIGWFSVWWQDPWITFVRPAFFYDAYFINMGNWTASIPWWVNPTSHTMGEPLLFMGGIYLGVSMMLVVAGAAVLRFCKARFPNLSTPQLIGIGLLCGMLFDLILELTWVKAGIYAYPAVISSWSVWAGKTYQFPLYESIFWGSVWGSSICLYYFRDDKGMTIIDRGLDRVQSVKSRPWIRLLAFVGFVNLTFALLYNVPYTLTTFHANATPEGYSSHMRSGMCGEGTDYDCASPNLPIPLPGTGPVNRDTFHGQNVH